jgi:hypothetical protein
MKHVFFAAGTALTFLFSSFVHASTLTSLNQTEVKNQLGGKTITTISLITMDGSLTNNTFTGFFNSDGTLEGKLSNQPQNGPTTDKGKWTTKSDGTLCATWEHWNNTKPICVSIYKVKNGLVLVNEKTHMLETVILGDNIKQGNQIG